MSQNDKLIPLSDEDLTQVSGGTSQQTPTINMTNIQSMDLETALMAVQSQRDEILSNQVGTQAGVVQKQQENIAELNGALGVFSSFTSSMTGNQTVTATTKVPGQDGTLGDAIETLKTMGIETGKLQEFATDGFNKEEMAQLAAFTKAGIDSQGNSMQMDMLRLQSLSNKRYEAFDVMTNFVKKMQDSRASIIGNMR